MLDTKEDNVRVNYKKGIEELCANTWEPLYHFVYFKVQNREEAEDITQEAYIKAISYMKNSDVKIDKIMGFLKTVSLNVIRDKWRKGKRQGKLINLEDMNPLEASVEDPMENIGQREDIENAMRLLNEEQRLIIDLRILRGYSVADTAKSLKITESNVRVLQYRALQKLAKLLKNEF